MFHLWLKLAEEALPEGGFPAAALPEFERLWREALLRVGIPPRAIDASPDVFFRVEFGIPYVRHSEVVRLLSGGCLDARPTSGNGFQVERAATGARSLPATLRLLKTRWKLEGALAELQETPSQPARPARDDLIASLALGLAIQALSMELAAVDERELAGWLASPEAAPRKVRRSIQRILKLQHARGRLSGAWKAFFAPFNGGAGSHPAESGEAPPHFWEDGSALLVPGNAAIVPNADECPGPLAFTGLPVAGSGRIEGTLWLPRENPDSCPPDAIAVFRHARPEAVEIYDRVHGVLFAEGGLLAHACMVAREHGIPCITGLGPAFYALAKAQPHARIRMDASTGTVLIAD